MVQEPGRPLLTVYHKNNLARVVNTEIQVNTVNVVGLHGAVRNCKEEVTENLRSPEIEYLSNKSDCKSTLVFSTS